MTVPEWILAGAILLEFVLRVLLELREARWGAGRFDRFSPVRVIPVLNDLFPAEANFSENDGGAFALAHEKAHRELHHGFLRRAFLVAGLLTVLIFLGVAGFYLRFNLFELLLLFHLIFAGGRLVFHALCFTEEYEADALAVKRVQRGVALRALDALAVREFPRTPLFAFVYRTHPTAVMRRARILAKR